MADAPRVTPLDVHESTLSSLGAREATPGAQVSVRVEPAEARAAGLALPETPNTWSFDASGREMLWLGPDEWLVVAETGRAGDIVREFDRILDGRHRSVIDASANRVVLELADPNRFELLQAGCGLDLHPRSWRTGRCAQTLLANVAVLLQERDGATHLFVRPSFAGWLVAWLASVSASG